MKNIVKYILLVCLASGVFACRYNVRDVGFVDLGGTPYAVYCFVNESTPQEFVEAFQEVTAAGLMDSNVVPVLVNVDTNKTHPAIRYLEKFNVRSYPTLLIVSGEGRPMPPIIFDGAADPKAKLWSLVDDLLKSQKRVEILDKLVKTFAVVVVVEGPNDDENKTARGNAEQAIKHIASQMNLMPKLVSKPPELVVVDHASVEKEKTLLWAICIDTNESDITKPFAAVMYGRGRVMGDVLEYDRANKDTLVGLLSIVGADCECGLDRKWMQGNMIPLVWDDDIQRMAAKNLGFDPENPTVKMEISLILKKGPNENLVNRDPDAIPAVGFGYQEIEVVFDKPAIPVVTDLPDKDADEEIEEQPTDKFEIPQIDITAPAVPEIDEVADGTMNRSILMIVGVAVIVIAIGLGIVLRGKGNQS